MPKFRSIHTKITQSFDFNEMPDDFTRLMWVLLPLGLDCEGRGIYNASWIKSKIFPLREDITNKNITDAMNWYVSRGMVEIYEVDGHSYFWVVKFTEYQRGFEKETPSILPSPIPDQLQSNSGVVPELVQTNSPLNSQTNTYTNSQTDTEEDAEETENPVVVSEKSKTKAASALIARGLSQDTVQELLPLRTNAELLDYCTAYDEAVDNGQAKHKGWLVTAIRKGFDVKHLVKIHREKKRAQDPNRFVRGYEEHFVH